MSPIFKALLTAVVAITSTDASSIKLLRGLASQQQQQQHQSQPGTATAMAGLEGEACDAEEYARYKTIVCSVEETCECADTVCKLDWCSEYVHKWKKEFGACILKGCEGEATPSTSGAPEPVVFTTVAP
mmetsp:Transcript_32870/g.49717  ORF Transcript_32870/g.49717 Transcript_32870/m.49717 type:complete len:129 (-) Transcript_32870:130-516(-)|eukprot:CAMPEP_0194762326 /NCGR_PEP_ID=MMETSP0323_2-20130528/15494_1 /TAXON_ID=2866 ORGANISM="Crypthecodinium cohnii, Strain Seligo" /NCGR_SAMPLE_ID=MMETSP0323_2 /ASSEMBLY_ACC=CAM_ASM_000346 /LENGTH=128 /DNA_ID=CAMNT_0039684615 /DNA_START=84 /DNA_END=470 /DNA_ORIENTATION=+